VMSVTRMPEQAPGAAAALRRPQPLPPEWSRTPLTVVMPTYNEADNLPRMAEALMSLDLTWKLRLDSSRAPRS
jgi:dolichol-phosphate mannosyltransferase